MLSAYLRYGTRHLDLLGLLVLLERLGLLEPDDQVHAGLGQGPDLVVVGGHGLLELLTEHHLLLQVRLRRLLAGLLRGEVYLRCLDLSLELLVLGTDLAGDLLLLGEDALLRVLALDLQQRLRGLVVLYLLSEPGDLVHESLVLGLLHLESAMGLLCLGHLQTLTCVYEAPGRLALLLELLQLGGKFLGDDAYAVQVHLGLGPLPAGLLDIGIETGDTGDAVEDAPPLDVTHLDYAGDVALLNEVVPICTDPRLGEQAVELRHGGLALVDVEMRTVIRTVVGQLHMTRELDDIVIPGHEAVRIVEDKGDTHVRCLVLRPSPIEDQVREFPGTYCLGALGTQHEKDGIGNIRLTGSIGSGDCSITFHQGYD